jgi:thymidylate synthase ThyX
MGRVFIIDEFSPQDTAMLQALYSRSSSSVTNHIDKVKETGSGEFMEKFYVGYGHASIADCGSTTIFVEGISILCDKIIQDWPLYSGQETSTRYVDMSKQPIIDPVKTSASKEILQKWLNFYVKSLPVVERFLTKKYPRQKQEEEGIYQKAIKARSFDILRSFLPAGITTQLSWHTNLRQAYDKLSWMESSPLKEAREVAKEIFSLLKDKYSHSFSHQQIKEQEEYRQKISQKYYYHQPKILSKDFIFKTNIDKEELMEKYGGIIKNRPNKTGLPNFLAELGNVNFEFLLDYGSFRDIQRHRNGVCRMPLLNGQFGFNSWYLEQLPEGTRKEAEKLILQQTESIRKMEVSPEDRQYYFALGYNVPCLISYGLPAVVYVTELRSGNMVHPTLRNIALKMRKALLNYFPELVLHCDTSEGRWNISRGFQDIVEK